MSILGQLGYINQLQQASGLRGGGDIGLAYESAAQIRQEFGLLDGPVGPNPQRIIPRDAAGLNPAEQAVLAMRSDPRLIPQAIQALSTNPNLLREALIALKNEPGLVPYLPPQLQQFFAQVLGAIR